jgi:hypothetical protein
MNPPAPCLKFLPTLSLPLIHQPFPVSDLLPALALLPAVVLLFPMSALLPAVGLLLPMSALLPVLVLFPAMSLPIPPQRPVFPLPPVSPILASHCLHRVALKSSQRVPKPVQPPPELAPASKSVGPKGKCRRDLSPTPRTGKRTRSDEDAMSSALSAGKHILFLF